MTVSTWVRGNSAGSSLAFGWTLMATVPRGSVLRRVRFTWNILATTSTLYSAPDIMDTVVASGVVTGYPDVSYTPPNPLTAPGDVAPPVERYLWWECRGLRPRTWGSLFDDVVTWEDTGPTEPTDSRAQVTASTPVGDNLGVFWTLAGSRSDFPGAGYIRTHLSWSVLYTT